MELSKEIIEANNLTEDQVSAINGFGQTQIDTLIADTKKEYDGKANANAEAILNSVADEYSKITGVTRNDKEKFNDFFNRSNGDYLSKQKTALETAKTEYDEKVSNFKGDSATAEALRQAKETLDSLQQKTADYDSLKEMADKYDPLLENFNTLKIGQSFSLVKPSFAEGVNQYEAAAKWGEFQKEVLSKYNIEIVDGEPMAIDKENQYKTEKLKDLVANEESLTALVKGRQQSGPGSVQTKKVTVEGLPFDIPEDAKTNAKARRDAIATHLTTQNMSPASQEWAAKFKEYNDKIMK
jgi:hypothetical protein